MYMCIHTHTFLKISISFRGLCCNPLLMKHITLEVLAAFLKLWDFALFFQNRLFIERKLNVFIFQHVGTKIHPFQNGHVCNTHKMVVCVVLQTRRETESGRTRITGFKRILLLVWTDTGFADKTKVNFSKMNYILICILKCDLLNMYFFLSENIYDY